jgi:hypothetical protein
MVDPLDRVRGLNGVHAQRLLDPERRHRIAPWPGLTSMVILLRRLCSRPAVPPRFARCISTSRTNIALPPPTPIENVVRRGDPTQPVRGHRRAGLWAQPPAGETHSVRPGTPARKGFGR